MEDIKLIVSQDEWTTILEAIQQARGECRDELQRIQNLEARTRQDDSNARVQQTVIDKYLF